jgi:hypothetical protein
LHKPMILNQHIGKPDGWSEGRDPALDALAVA